MFVKPAPGLRIRGPNRQLLPAEGAEVPESSFWMRRLRSGDVALAPAPIEVVPTNQIPESELP